MFFVLGFLVYAYWFNNPFIMDDQIQILSNDLIHSLSNFKSFFTNSTMSSGGGVRANGIYYKPLMTTFYAIIWNFFGADPFFYRLPLLIVHILSSWLIYLFSKNFLEQTPALFLGLLFLLHPLNSEVVYYIADAQDIFYFFFGMLSLISICKIKSPKRLFFSLLCLYLLGLFSKETGALFLIFGVMYSYLLYKEKLKTVIWASIIVGASYLILRILIGLITLTSHQLHFNHASFLERLKMLPLILSHYIELFIFPMRLSITTDFVLKDYSVIQFWIPLIVVVIFTFILIRVFKRISHGPQKNYAYFFLGVLFFWFLLHGQMIHPLDGVYADRWFYIGVWALSSIFIIYFNRFFNRRVGKNLFIGLLIIMGVRSFYRGSDWSDPLVFYQREFNLHPWDAVMSNNVGVELFSKGRIDEAQIYFSKSIELNSKWSVSYNNLGAVREAQKNYKEALELYYKSLSLSAYALAYENYVSLLITMGNYTKAEIFLNEKALALFPYNRDLRRAMDFIQNKKLLLSPLIR